MWMWKLLRIPLSLLPSPAPGALVHGHLFRVRPSTLPVVSGRKHCFAHYTLLPPRGEPCHLGLGGCSLPHFVFSEIPLGPLNPH
ncbi:hypothetical protein VTI28DRAFT_5090 [Corynascus sepedonium]